jgi:uncharacterized protein (TIGR02452 family)
MVWYLAPWHKSQIPQPQLSKPMSKPSLDICIQNPNTQWGIKMSSKNNREIAQQTINNIETGCYRHNGQIIYINEMMIESINSSRLYTPEQLQRLDVAQKSPRTTQVKVSAETTLQASERLVAQHGQVVALNFASARNPGGGFLNGAQAQEESLARSSGLYPSLNHNFEFYHYHRKQKSLLYSHHMIFSPRVPVFRRDNGDTLPQPYLMDIITSAAPNRGTANSADLQQLPTVFGERIELLLKLCANLGHEHLLLGAWGCGVFRNDPVWVANTFANTLSSSFSDIFSSVTFAVFDNSDDKRILSPFIKAFGDTGGSV